MKVLPLDGDQTGLQPEWWWFNIRIKLLLFIVLFFADETGGHVTRVQNTLVIDNVTPDDAGTYTCVAKNLDGEKSLDVVVTIGCKCGFFS